jgi:SAM-dependent methyltransferase
MDSWGNPVRGPLNAALFRVIDGYVHRALGPRKRELFASLPETVVEIGPGTGANLRYYRPGTRLVAIEPNRHMHASLAAAARRHGVELELRAVGAEATGLPEGGADVVVSTLVLCTVPDQATVLREIQRVLRPGGRLLLLEHVHAPDHPVYGPLQRWLARPWRWAIEGCDLRRDTERALLAAGFAVDVQRYRARTVFLPINPQIAGTATR